MREYRKGEKINFRYTKGKSDIYYSKTFHDYYEIYLFLGGDAEFVSNHVRQKLSPYQMALIPPGEYHQFVVGGNVDDYERCVIDIYPGFLEENRLSAAFRGKDMLSLSESDRIVEHFMYLVECVLSLDDADFLHILPAIATDIVFLIKNNSNTRVLSSENLSGLSVNAIDYIDEHFAEQIVLEMLAQKFFCSVSSLCHTFKKDFGISIKKYILQKRLNAAKMAIRRGEKIEEASIKCGFVNYSTFYRDYKKYFGESPSGISKK